MERPPIKKTLESPAPDAKAQPPAVQGMSQSNNYDWAIGCNIFLRTTLGEEMTGKVFAFDRLTNCLTLVEKGDSPGLVNYRVLKATFIKEVISAQRPTNPPDMHLPFVDLHEVIRREEMALDMPLLASPVTETIDDVPSRNPVDPSTEEGQSLGQGGLTEEPPSSPTGRLATNGPVAGDGSPALQEPPQEPIGDAPVSKTSDTQTQSLSPEEVSSEQSLPVAAIDGHPVPDATTSGFAPAPAPESNTSGWKEQDQRVPPPKPATQQSMGRSKPLQPSVQGAPGTRPWGPGHSAGGALSKSSAGMGPSAGLPATSRAAPGVENGPQSPAPATKAGMGTGPAAGPAPAVAAMGLQGHWARGRPKITRDP